MSLPIAILQQIFFPVILSIIFSVAYDKLFRTSRTITVDSFPHSTYFSSSVYCRGFNHTDRLCHFQNICFEPKLKQFIYFSGENSVESGLPDDRFSPALVDFSSVFDHNTQYFNYVEVPQSTIPKFNVSFVSNDALIFKRFNPDNIMHVFHDDLLPVFVTLSELSLIEKDKTPVLVIADSRPSGPYAQLYDKFLNQQPLYIMNLSIEQVHCFKNAYIGLNKQSTWYQYGFNQPQGSIKKSFEKLSNIIKRFKMYFIQQFSLFPSSGKNIATLFSRKNNRRILNEKAIKLIVQNATNLQTSVVSLDKQPIFEIIQRVIDSQFLVGMHGSLMILSIFLDPNSTLIELFPFGVPPEISVPYKTLCEIPSLSLHYFSWQNIIQENSFPHPEYPPELGGISHLPFDKQKEIEHSIVKPFLCCSDPVWLYRIYQDTVVDTNTFGNLIQLALNNWKNFNYIVQRQEIFYPSNVLNLSCTRTEIDNNMTVTVMWNEPWNVSFFNCSNLEYELWIQNVKSNNIQAFIMKSGSFKFPKYFKSVQYYVWVRCYACGKAGPFNSSPLICFK